jgi:hypothetical protein
MRNRLVAAALLALAIPTAAWAATAGDVQDVSLTVYNNNLALIRELRPLHVDAGTQTVVLTEVSGQLRPETVHLSTVQGLELELLEQNYDYDLVSRHKLLERFIGRQIVMIDDQGKMLHQGTLLSVMDGIVLSEEGRIILDPPGRVMLPEGAADNLLLRPTLSWMLNSPKAADVTAEVSYLSGGLSWSADYVFVMGSDDKAADLEGWVTLSNYSGTTYNDARLKLVAGEVNQVPTYDMMAREEAMAMPAPAPAKAGGFQEEAFFEYHLYDLQRRTTIKNSQQKQVGLLTAAGIPTTKTYVFNGMSGGDVRVMVEFKNAEENGLGMPLPAGIVRVYKADSQGALQFAGEDRIEHTPTNEKLDLHLGNAFDVVGEAVQTNHVDLGKGYEQSWKSPSGACGRLHRATTTTSRRMPTRLSSRSR